MEKSGRFALRVIAGCVFLGLVVGEGFAGEKAGKLLQSHHSSWGRRAKNVILFVGDGMGVSTITATRVYSVGVSGERHGRSVPLHGPLADLFSGCHHRG